MAEKEWSDESAPQTLPEAIIDTDLDATEAQDVRLDGAGEASSEPPAQASSPKQGKRSKASSSAPSRSHKTKQQAEALSAASATTPEMPKKAARARKTKSTKARRAHPRKKSVQVVPESAVESAGPSEQVEVIEAAGLAEVVQAIETLQAGEQVVESEQDEATVKMRAIGRAARQAELFSYLELDVPPTEAATDETSSEIEATLKRPVVRLQPSIETPSPARANGQPVELPEPALEVSPSEPTQEVEPELDEAAAPQPASAATLIDPARPDLPEIADTPLPGFDVASIPETPVAPASTEVSIPETPFPSLVEEYEAGAGQDGLVESELMGPEQSDGVVAVLEAIPVATPPAPVVEAAERVTAPPVVEEQVREPEAQSLKGRVGLVLLIILVLSLVLLWQDASDAHLYLYSINALDGRVQAHQDLGGGYANTTGLTNPVLVQSSLLVGLSTGLPAGQADQSPSQCILSLTGGETSWSVSQQIAAPLAHATLNVTPGHDVVVAYTGGVQVLTPDGRLLWQTQVEGPSQGPHAFSPAFDDTTLYTVKAAHSGVIAAYDLRSGAMRWSQQLGDSFDYAPPFLLSGSTLFVAGDHTIYALNRGDGRLLWKASAPVRTLLLDQAGRPLLIAASAAGLLAFDAQRGGTAWSFDGRPRAGDSTILTGAQFYQAGLSGTGDMVYASGIVWNAQQAREQLWLYAVDASSGKARWSEQIGADFASADAGRVLVPFVDATLGLVLLEVAQADGSHILTAYNTSDGSLRWSTELASVRVFAPGFLPAAHNSIDIFSIQADAVTTLHSWSWSRLLLLALSAASILLLFGLWIFPPASWPRRSWAALKAPLRGSCALARLAGKWWLHFQHARLLVTCCLIATLVGTGILTYFSLSRPQQFLNSVEASSGSTQWQHALDTPSTLSGADGQESFVVAREGPAFSILSALNADGSARWSTPASEGHYSLPAVQTPPGTVLVALSGPTSAPYAYAPDDPAYPHPLAHLFSLSLLESATGRVLWQSVVTGENEAQNSVVLASDAQYIYVASRSIPAEQPMQATRISRPAVVQLIAIDKASGTISWRVYGPREDGAPDFGALLPRGRLLYWQIDSTVYALDTQLGQIQWRQPVAEVDPATVALEESQIAISSGVLLIRRSDQYHALDAATGKILWSISGSGSPTTQSPGGILATRGEFILYGNGVIEALNTSTQAVIWRHENLATISDAMVAPDGSLVYAVVQDSLEGTPAQQALVAFDVQDSAIRWTFQPSEPASFTYAGAPPLHSARGMLYVTLCLSSSSPSSSASAALSSCASQMLYGINEASGTVSLKFGASQVSSVQVSQDGGSIVFQTISSAWDNLKDRFQG